MAWPLSSFKNVRPDNHPMGSWGPFTCERIPKRVQDVRLDGCFEDLRHFSYLSAISRLGSKRWPISEIVMVRPGIEPRTSCSASQQLKHYTTAAPPPPPGRPKTSLLKYLNLLAHTRWRNAENRTRISRSTVQPATGISTLQLYILSRNIVNGTTTCITSTFFSFLAREKTKDKRHS